MWLYWKTAAVFLNAAKSREWDKDGIGRLARLTEEYPQNNDIRP